MARHLHDQYDVFESRRETLRIEKASPGGSTTIRLIGHLRSEHIEELRKQLPQKDPGFVLDLTELMFVDVDVVRFLGACEAGGAEVINCSAYIREWMNEERKV
jgi:hypothetical protein